MEGYLRKKDNNEKFIELWDGFVAELAAGPRYTSAVIDYYLHLSKEREFLIDDESVVLFASGKPVGLAFLPIEDKDGVRSISNLGSYVWAPIYKDERIRKQLFAYVDEIALKHHAQKIMFGVDPLLFGRYPYNYLLPYGYFNTSGLSYLIDLTLPGDLMKHCRRGHVSDIKTVLKDPDCKPFFIDAAHPSYEVHEEYRELHRIDAGRATRSKDSFDTQYSRLEAGNGVLFGVRYKGKCVAYSYFEMAHGKAIYFSAASDPEMTHLPLYHVLLLNAMNYLKERGVTHIDAGQPSSPSAQFDYFPDTKMQNIARFKRGFGGTYANEFRGIKYIDPKLFENEFSQFRDDYMKYLNIEKHVQE